MSRDKEHGANVIGHFQEKTPVIGGGSQIPHPPEQVHDPLSHSANVQESTVGQRNPNVGSVTQFWHGLKIQQKE